jgi:hypothetical protein
MEMWRAICPKVIMLSLDRGFRRNGHYSSMTINNSKLSLVTYQPSLQ